MYTNNLHRISICILLFLSLRSPAYALTLAEAIELAWQNDPTFIAAQANLNISRERASQASAGILPQVTVSANTNSNWRNYDLFTSPPSGAAPTETFNSNSAQISLTQPLWKRSNMIAMNQADLNVGQADFQLKSAAQELLVRMAQAWFDVMLAQDGMIPAEIQIQAARQQLEVARHGHERGVLSRTELEDAHAKFELALAEQAAARSELEIKLASLEQIIGPVAFSPPQLSDHIATPRLEIQSLDEWLAQAETGNPTLLAMQRALEASDEEIRKQRAGHEPTLDIVASHTKSVQGAGVSGGQLGFESRQSVIGIQFNMPLYSGGGQNAKVREALASREKARQEREAARRNAQLAVKQAWFTWRASQIREVSGLRMLQSAELTFKGEQSARAKGVKSELDVLQAQQKNAAALRDWHKARYESILSQIRLKAACGQLNGNDLAEFEQVFISTRN